MMTAKKRKTTKTEYRHEYRCGPEPWRLFLVSKSKTQALASARTAFGRYPANAQRVVKVVTVTTFIAGVEP